MKLIKYPELYYGNVVILPVLPPILSNDSKYALVTGVVGAIKDDNIILANTVNIRSILENKLSYKRSRIEKDNIRMVIESLSDKTLCLDQTPKIGDMILASMRDNNYYIGFVNEMDNGNLLLTNFHPGYRAPWKLKNSLFMPADDTEYSFTKLLTNEDIERYFSLKK